MNFFDYDSAILRSWDEIEERNNMVFVFNHRSNSCYIHCAVQLLWDFVPVREYILTNNAKNNGSDGYLLYNIMQLIMKYIVDAKFTDNPVNSPYKIIDMEQIKDVNGIPIFLRNDKNNNINSLLAEYLYIKNMDVGREQNLETFLKYFFDLIPDYVKGFKTDPSIETLPTSFSEEEREIGPGKQYVLAMSSDPIHLSKVSGEIVPYFLKGRIIHKENHYIYMKKMNEYFYIDDITVGSNTNSGTKTDFLSVYERGESNIDNYNSQLNVLRPHELNDALPPRKSPIEPQGQRVENNWGERFDKIHAEIKKKGYSDDVISNVLKPMFDYYSRTPPNNHSDKDLEQEAIHRIQNMLRNVPDRNTASSRDIRDISISPSPDSELNHAISESLDGYTLEPLEMFIRKHEMREINFIPANTKENIVSTSKRTKTYDENQYFYLWDWLRTDHYLLNKDNDDNPRIRFDIEILHAKYNLYYRIFKDCKWKILNPRGGGVCGLLTILIKFHNDFGITMDQINEEDQTVVKETITKFLIRSQNDFFDYLNTTEYKKIGTLYIGDFAISKDTNDRDMNTCLDAVLNGNDTETFLLIWLAFSIRKNIIVIKSTNQIQGTASSYTGFINLGIETCYYFSEEITISNSIIIIGTGNHFQLIDCHDEHLFRKTFSILKNADYTSFTLADKPLDKPELFKKMRMISDIYNTLYRYNLCNENPRSGGRHSRRKKPRVKFSR